MKRTRYFVSAPRSWGWACLACAGTALVVACATSSDDPPRETESPLDSGSQLPDPTDAETSDASDARPDAESLRCSGEFCLVDVPNAAGYGISEWLFSGVYADSTAGVWAIANGVAGRDDGATTQLLRFENDAWKVERQVQLDVGTSARNVRLVSLSGNGAGKLLAVGISDVDGQGVVFRGDAAALSFTTEAFEADLRGSWFASADQAWIVGAGGRIFRSSAQGEWESVGPVEGDFSCIWGRGPDDVYVGGSVFDPDWGDNFGAVGRLVASDAGEPSWVFARFDASFVQPFGVHDIAAGVAVDGVSWWSAEGAFARSAETETGWELDAFQAPVPLRSFWARSSTDVWAVGDIGRIYHYDGTSWKALALVFNGAPLTANLTSITGTSAGELFVVGDGIALRRKAP